MSSYLDFNGLKRYHENSKEYVDSKVPTKVSDLTNDSGYITDENLNSTLANYAKSSDVPSIDGLATEDYVDEQIANLVDSAPDTMNTLNELATAISDNESVVEALDSAITNKVDKEEGKGLFSGSYNDLTNKPTIPSKVSELTNDSGYAINDDVQAEFDVRNLKTYNSLGKLGLSVDTVTSPDTIPLALGGNAMLSIQINNTEATTLYNNGIIPKSYGGSFTVTNSGGRSSYQYISMGEYSAIYRRDIYNYITSSPIKWNDWQRIATETDLEAETSVRNLKTYTSLSQLGKTIDSVTSLKGLLPNDSKLTLTVNNAEKEALYNKGIIPVSAAGVLIVTNYNMRGEARFIQDMVKSIYVGQTSNTWNTDYDWQRIATETDLENLVISSSTTLEDLGVTATATELNYVDGVTSNIQTQLDGKASTSVSTTSKNGLMSSTDKAKLDNTNIAYATCSTAADTAAKVATITGNSNWTLKVGSIVVVKFTVTNTASNVTLNVNSTGAKSIWYNNAVYTGNSNNVCGYANRYTTYMYDGTNWVWISNGTDSNTTYTNASLGQGYGTCSTAEATTAKVVSLSNYALTTGGIVAVKFTYAVPASATMNINSKGAKAIYNRGSAIAANVIKAGDIATFIYNGSQYHLLTVDRDNNSDTKNTAGTTNKTATKLFLAGATSQGSNPVTYSNSGVYIGTDNCLYSNSKKVTTTTYSTTAPSVREVGTVWIG